MKKLLHRSILISFMVVMALAVSFITFKYSPSLEAYAADPQSKFEKVGTDRFDFASRLSITEISFDKSVFGNGERGQDVKSKEQVLQKRAEPTTIKGPFAWDADNGVYYSGKVTPGKDGMTIKDGLIQWKYEKAATLPNGEKVDVYITYSNIKLWVGVVIGSFSGKIILAKSGLNPVVYGMNGGGNRYAAHMDADVTISIPDADEEYMFQYTGFGNNNNSTGYGSYSALVSFKTDQPTLANESFTFSAPGKVYVPAFGFKENGNAMYENGAGTSEAEMNAWYGLDGYAKKGTTVLYGAAGAYNGSAPSPLNEFVAPGWRSHKHKVGSGENGRIQTTRGTGHSTANAEGDLKDETDILDGGKGEEKDSLTYSVPDYKGVEYTMTPDQGYKIGSLKINDNPVTDVSEMKRGETKPVTVAGDKRGTLTYRSNGTYTFSFPGTANDQSIYVTWVRNVSDVNIAPYAEKYLYTESASADRIVPSGAAAQLFEFNFVPANKKVIDGDNEYDNLASEVKPLVTMPVKNSGKNVLFGNLTFEKPSSGDVHAYLYRIYENKGTSAAIREWDTTDRYMKVIVTPPASGEEDKGTKAVITIGKSNGSSIDWGQPLTVYGDGSTDKPTDPQTAPVKVEIDDFLNKTEAAQSAAIEVQKRFTGRTWKDGETFVIALLTEEKYDPMPADTETTSGIRHANVNIKGPGTLESSDTYVENGSFGEITYTLADMLDTDGTVKQEKTFTYHIREATADEAGIGRIPGVTYSTERYKVKITVHHHSNDTITVDDPVITDAKDTPTTLPSFTNTYSPNTTIYRMSADKDYESHVDSDRVLEDKDYNFELRPIGSYAKINPMPKNTEGEGEDRVYQASNIGQQIKFEDITDSSDGLKFTYADIKQKLIDGGYYSSDEEVEAALHGDGVDFEYEMYEVIPDEAVNNDDGTFSLHHDDGTTTVYDGIHHTRKITAKVHTVTDDEGTKIVEFYVEGHADDHTGDYYIDSNGHKHSVSRIPGYDFLKHHTSQPDGVPVFVNYHVQDFCNVQVSKVWDDGGDDHLRTGIAFTLYQTVNGDKSVVTEDIFGEQVDVKTIESLTDDYFRWKHLPLTDSAGNKITYSVEETGASDEYAIAYIPPEVTPKQSETAEITVRNIIPLPVTKTVKQTIHYVTNKGVTVFEDYNAELAFTAYPTVKEKLGAAVLDKGGNRIVEWRDEDGTLLGTDKGDGSGINWKKSSVTKQFEAVKSPEKYRYTYDRAVVSKISVKAISKDVVDTVVYTPDAYKVHFDANGGSGWMSSQSMTWDKQDSLNANRFKRRGYRFIGWNTEADGSGIAYKDKESVINFVNEDGSEITLYAQWEKDGSAGADTGDSNMLIPIAGIMAAALAALITMIIIRKRDKS